MPRPKAKSRPGTTWTVEIPGFHPTSLNVLMRMHWTSRATVAAKETIIIGLYCRKAGVPEATGKRRVTMRLTLAGRDRKRDDDNAWKFVLDCLRSVGMLVDDGPAWVERMPLQQERGPRRMTTLILEDLPCE